MTYADLWDCLRDHYNQMRINDLEIPFLDRPQYSRRFPPFFQRFF